MTVAPTAPLRLEKNAPTSALHNPIAIAILILRERDGGRDIIDSEAITKVAKEVEADLVPRINPDRRYVIAELGQFGFKPGLLYKRHKHLIRKDGHRSYILVNRTAPRLASAPAADMVANFRRRGRPRKDAQRSTTDDSTDSLTIQNVAANDNRVIRIHRWMYQMEDYSVQKAA